MKFLYVYDLDKKHIGHLRELLHEGIYVDHVTSRELEDITPGEYQGLICGFIPGKFLRETVDLKYFVIPFAGIPQKNRSVLEGYPDITVINSHFNSRFVAEHGWALLLASAKKIVYSHEKLKMGDWTPRYDFQHSQSLEGKTLLLLGYGHLGKEIARFARTFDMRVEAIKRTPSQESSLDFLGTLKDLHSRLPLADFIMVLLPMTDETTNFLDREEFSLMKDGVILINIGRGEVINEEALYDALEKGKLGGVALDTWWIYPESEEGYGNTMPSNYLFHLHDNVIFSPHRSAHVEIRESTRMRSVANILNSIYRGEPVKTVDINRGY